MKNNKKILLVEDDLSLLEIFTMALELKGYEVFQAKNGMEALEVIFEKDADSLPDCIVLDILMPHMNGNSFLNVLHNSYRSFFEDVPVIVCTAWKGEVNSKYVHKQIQKPVSLDYLTSVVDEALNINRSSEISLGF